MKGKDIFECKPNTASRNLFARGCNFFCAALVERGAKELNRFDGKRKRAERSGKALPRVRCLPMRHLPRVHCLPMRYLPRVHCLSMRHLPREAGRLRSRPRYLMGAASFRYLPGEMPINLWKERLKYASLSKPQSKAISRIFLLLSKSMIAALFMRFC